MKRILIYLTAGALLAAALTACSSRPSQQSQPDSSAPAAPSSSQSEGIAQEGELLIGVGDVMSEVAYGGELTPEALIEAISAETGWDLTLAGPVEGLQDGEGNIYGYRIGFAETSCLYVGPPDPQKDEYHVFDATDMVLTALNSVAETLRRNLDVYEVYFTSPDGGDIDLPNAAFHLSADYIWDYQGASISNEPLPADSIGYLYTPGEELIGGVDHLQLICIRPGVQPGEGNFTVTGADGAVLAQFSAADADHVEMSGGDPAQLAQYNLREGTVVDLHLDAPLPMGEAIQLTLDEGFLASGELRSKEALFSLSTLDYGVSGSTLPDSSELPVGATETISIALGGEAAKAVVEVDDPALVTATPTELTESGDLTLTFPKAGTAVIAVWFLDAQGNYLSNGLQLAVDIA